MKDSNDLEICIMCIQVLCVVGVGGWEQGVFAVKTAKRSTTDEGTKFTIVQSGIIGFSVVKGSELLCHLFPLSFFHSLRAILPPAGAM